MFNLNKFIGNSGESLVEKYLKTCGYKIKNRNLSTKYTEIDILAEKDNILYIFEVKTNYYKKSVSQGNTLNAFRPELRVSSSKIIKLKKFVQYYFNKNIDTYENCKLGVIAVNIKEGSKEEIEIIWI